MKNKGNWRSIMNDYLIIFLILPPISLREVIGSSELSYSIVYDPNWINKPLQTTSQPPQNYCKYLTRQGKDGIKILIYRKLNKINLHKSVHGFRVINGHQARQSYITILKYAKRWNSSKDQNGLTFWGARLSATHSWLAGRGGVRPE